MEKLDQENTHLEYFKRTRKWLPNLEVSQDHEHIIRIMSYNVLANSYLSHVDYKDTDWETLLWKNRHKQVNAELQYLRPDIIWFQELEDEDVSQTLLENNYASWYIYKTQGNKDCVAIFWKMSKFECIGTWTIQFGLPNTTSQLYWKPQVACFTALRVDKDVGDKIIIVATTHLIFNNNRGDQKLAQLNLIMQWFEEIKFRLSEVYPEHEFSLVLGGDFNSTAKSGIYQYMTKGEYDCTTLRRNNISGQTHIFKSDEEGFRSVIEKIQPDEDADVIMIEHWFTEISYTYPYLPKDSMANHFYVKTKGGLGKVTKDSRDLHHKYKNYQRQMRKKAQQKLLQESNDSDEDLEFVSNDKSETDEKPELKGPQIVLKNPAGTFKSAYSEGIKQLSYILGNLENDDESVNSEYIKLLNNINEDLDSFQSYQTDETNVIYGAFKPDFSSKTNFDSYWLNTTREPAYSVWTHRHTLVDFIFYQSEWMQVLRVLDVPNIYTDLEGYEIYPNKEVPSDHIPMVADFYLM